MASVAQVGRTVGRYTLLRRIATGGMGEVYLARHQSMQGVERFFAIKLLLPQYANNKDVVDMFITEARITAQITHPNICQVFELGIEDDELFICMEYLRGIPANGFLKSHNPSEPVPLAISVAIVQQAATGLGYAHELSDKKGINLGVVHRDVSPGNIFVTITGAVKALDFGVVKARDSAHKTQTGVLKGKFGYMSPEQVMAKELDRRSDIFSLGIVLFELLTNERLFDRGSEFETLQAITELPIPLLCDVRPAYPLALSQVLEKALSQDVEKRYTSMRAFSEALTSAMSNVGGIANTDQIADYMGQKFGAELEQIDLMLAQEVQTRLGGGDTKVDTLEILADEEKEQLKSLKSESSDKSSEFVDTSQITPLPFQRSFQLSKMSSILILSIVALFVLGGLVAIYLLKQGSQLAPAGIVYEGQLTAEKNTPQNYLDSKDKQKDTLTEKNGTDTSVLGKENIKNNHSKKGNSKRNHSKEKRKHLCESKKTAESRNRCYVAKSSRGLSQCINEHASRITGTPKLMVRFNLAQTGKVLRVSLSPAAIESSPLGVCMKKVAKKIRFGKQPGPLNFTIPLNTTKKKSSSK